MKLRFAPSPTLFPLSMAFAGTVKFVVLFPFLAFKIHIYIVFSQFNLCVSSRNNFEYIVYSGTHSSVQNDLRYSNSYLQFPQQEMRKWAVHVLLWANFFIFSFIFCVFYFSRQVSQ